MSIIWINRYYSSQYARFITPDPYQASGGPADPQSWNRYTYVQSDPLNASDPAGLFMLSPQGPTTIYNPPFVPPQVYWDPDVPDYGFSKAGPPMYGHLAGINMEIDDHLGRTSKGSLFQSALALAIRALQPGTPCAGLFSGIDTISAVKSLAGRIRYEDFTTFNPPDGAVRWSGDAATYPVDPFQDKDGTWKAKGVYVYINSSTAGSKFWFGSQATDEDRARLLIHELGHVFNFTLGASSLFSQDDNLSASGGSSNQNLNQTLEHKCIP